MLARPISPLKNTPSTSLISLIKKLALTSLLFLISPLSGSAKPCTTPCTHLFIQPGIATGAHALTLGVTYDWNRHWNTPLGTTEGYWEITAGYWKNRDNQFHDITQIGLTPVFRLHPTIWPQSWYLEGGIGANILSPLYSSGTKQFSTAFNFGDHIAIGYQFGQNFDKEIALRFQHFSNADIKKPNPGENFIQLRYTWRW